jgi:hypothetical protein
VARASRGVANTGAGGYLRAVGIGLRPPGEWGKTVPPKPANGVTTDSGAERIFPARTPMFCLPRSGRRRVRHCERLSSPIRQIWVQIQIRSEPKPLAAVLDDAAPYDRR